MEDMNCYFWSNGNYRYFTIDINHDLIDSSKVIRDILSQPFANSEGVYQITIQNNSVYITIDNWLKQIKVTKESVKIFDWKHFNI